jgi:hypothetical protein
MLGKSRTLAVGLSVAGLIGFGATMASAAPMPGIGNNANIALPVCGNNLNANAGALQALVPNATVIGGAGNTGAGTKNTELSNSGCVVANSQRSGGWGDDDGGALNNANVAAPICGNNVNVNVLAGQVLVPNLTALLNLMSPLSQTSNTEADNRGCAVVNSQQHR